MAKNKESTSAKPQKPSLWARSKRSVGTWFNADEVKKSSFFVKDSFRRLFIIQKPTHNENFNTAIERLNLSEEDVIERQKNFHRLAGLMFLFAFICLIYTIYLLYSAYFDGGALALIVTLLCFASACRYHFWYFQVKNRKLGCTLKEWLNASVNGEKE